MSARVTAGLWVVGGIGVPFGARYSQGAEEHLGPAKEGTRWLDLCTLGQHLPQMYRISEIHGLTAEQCPSLGLCDHCLGFGDVSTARGPLVRAIDQVASLCPNCAGSGRPSIRLSVRRTREGVDGDIRPLPHAYVPALPEYSSGISSIFSLAADICMACMMPVNGTGPHGEELHT